ncbi:MAG: transcription elongation factor GreA [Brevefilum sp.]|nr:transcription elongation factor GreA [Brevefilum sp.]MDT8382429.1 transcription elongation factor GreA [Brevefilum sp.]MDW7755366.1 transcription elongation factor GreA [Brevefilum sp.]
MNDIHYLTPEGKQKLEQELAELTTNGRNDLALRLKHAISMGDLSENADYHKAKEDQGFLEGRIQEIQNTLKNAEVIESQESYSEVSLGATITIQEEGYPPETYHLVGIKEANPREGKISHESPIGYALLGHKVGEVVKVKLPNNNTTEFKILAIE